MRTLCNRGGGGEVQKMEINAYIINGRPLNNYIPSIFSPDSCEQVQERSS